MQKINNILKKFIRLFSVYTAEKMQQFSLLKDQHSKFTSKQKESDTSLKKVLGQLSCDISQSNDKQPELDSNLDWKFEQLIDSVKHSDTQVEEKLDTHLSDVENRVSVAFTNVSNSDEVNVIGDYVYVIVSQIQNHKD